MFISQTPNTHTYALPGFFAESSVTRIMKQKQNVKEMKKTDANIRLLFILVKTGYFSWLLELNTHIKVMSKKIVMNFNANY